MHHRLGLNGNLFLLWIILLFVADYFVEVFGFTFRRLMEVFGLSHWSTNLKMDL